MKVSEHTWRQHFIRVVTSLAPDARASRALVGAFDAATDEWCNQTADLGSGLLSGICPDGGPIEVSVRDTDSGRRSVRFITQPYLSATPADWPEIREAVTAYLSLLSGRSAALFARSAFDDLRLARESWAADGGTFAVWVGLSAGDRTHPQTKLYINPWCAPAPMSGFPAMYKLLSLAGRTGDALSVFRWVVEWLPGMSPGICGVNLDAHGPTAAKAYFSKARVTRRMLVDAVRRWDTIGVLSHRLGSLLDRTTAASGEVHLTTSFSASLPEPQLSFNLYCPHWFESDEHLVSVMEDLAIVGSGLTQSIRRVLDGWPFQGPCITFVGVSGRDITVYFKVVGSPA